MERERAKALTDKILRFSRATETEVTLGGGRMAVTRFANNHVHQNVEESWPHVSVRVGLRRRGGWHTGRASTTVLDTASLRQAVQSAMEAARLSRADPGYVPMPYPDEAGTWPGEVASAYDPSTSKAGPASRVNLVSEVVLPARRGVLAAAGQITVTDGSIGNYGSPGIICIANSRGLFQYHRSTEAHMSCTVQHESGSTGWARSWSHSLASIDAEAVGARAIKKAIGSARPRELPPGKYTVVLEPEATASLLWFLMPQFARRNFDEGRSRVGESLGDKIFPIKMSLFDDPYHKDHLARPFDGEGIPTQRVELVRVGVPKGFLYTRRSAKKHKYPPTGHSRAQPSASAAVARAPVIEGGKGGLDDLISGTERGLLVTRLWYNRFVDFRDARVTGMTRDGLFLIEGGEIVGGVKNMRYNASVIDALSRVDAMGYSVRAGGAVVPPMRIRDFQFTGSTRF